MARQENKVRREIAAVIVLYPDGSGQITIDISEEELSFPLRKIVRLVLKAIFRVSGISWTPVTNVRFTP